MAENDIYNSKRKYSIFKENIGSICEKPEKTGSKRKYYCRNRENIQFFYKLFKVFDFKDMSYIRRIRLLQTLKLICYATDRVLKECDRKEINRIISYMHSAYKSPKSKADFIKDIKYLWKILFPEIDEKGREDETLVPYQVRHLSCKMDRSREKLKNDRLKFEEYEKIVAYFGRDPRIQAYITFAHESLGRPQEILYIRIKDVELHDNYAKVYISEHGKEGCGLLVSIDSYPYLLKWLEVHPFRKSPDSFLFVNLGHKSTGRQLTPFTVNKMLKKACKDLWIDKPVTCYSLKRNGVTFRRLRGESDVEIQHIARWKSTKQLSTYDYSVQEDALKLQLIRKGILKPGKEHEDIAPKTKTCQFCNTISGFTAEICSVCKRPLDRGDIKKEYAAQEIQIDDIRKEMDVLKNALDIRRQYDEDIARLLKIPHVKRLYRRMYKSKIQFG